MGYLWFAAIVAATTFLLHVRTTCMIFVGIALLLSAIAYAQVTIFHVTDGLFTSHWMYATLFLRAGTEALRSDGGLVSVHPSLGLTAVFILLMIGVHEIIVTHLHMFHNYVHLLIYTVGASLALSASSERLLDMCCPASPAVGQRWKSRKARALSPIRQIIDPVGFCAMGLILLGHVHDPTPLAISFHSAFGYTAIILGMSIFFCALAHDIMPFESRACATMRRVHSYAWILTGNATIAMCVVMYLPGGGFKGYLMSRNINPGSNFEESSTYLAATGLFSAIHLALLHLSSPRKGSDDEAAVEAGKGLSAAEEAEPMVPAGGSNGSLERLNGIHV